MHLHMMMSVSPFRIAFDDGVLVVFALLFLILQESPPGGIPVSAWPLLGKKEVCFGLARHLHYC